VLFGVAINSAKDIQPPIRAGGRMQALVSVVFSFTAVEAFLNEATEMALGLADIPGEPEAVAVFAECMMEAKNRHASVDFKLLSQTGFW